MPNHFVPPDTKLNYSADRPAAVEHIRLDVKLDLDARTIAGRSTLSLRARRDGVATVTLHAVDMEVSRVEIDGVRAPGFDYDGLVLQVALPKPRSRGTVFAVAVDYTARPRRGLYFLAPDPDDPKRPKQCWTQGQDEDARFFFPCIDAPVEKATSEVICVAPRGKLVLSNGKLLSREPVAGNGERWHYSLEVPHSSYLVTLVCGDFTEIRANAPETQTAVHYFGPPGRETDIERTLGRTPAMIDFFSRRIGIPYPHERYSQIIVADFIFGGMENTTATTLTDQALLDERAAIDHDMDALVAHELAHQWWGDLVTCREWSEGWLNEGFATYFEYIWHEHALGRDEADVRLQSDLDAYLTESGDYQRPIVCRQYREPIELFDAHLYDKGGRVLHMLRHELGDGVFFAALKLYGQRHARGAVETRDLTRACEEASGRSLDRFFDQWVGRPGHVELSCAWEWNDERGIGTLRVAQTQDGGGPHGTTPYVFEARVRFEIQGKSHDEIVSVTERSHAFELRLPRKPTQAVFDPGGVLLKSIKMEKPLPLWTRELEAATLAIDRVSAARALGDKHEPKAIAALARALKTDPLWAVRAEAATALGKLARGDALDALLPAQKDGHPKVRQAVAAALGRFVADPRAAEALSAWVSKGDASYFVEANAARALAQTRDPRAIEVLPGVLKRDSFQDVIRSRAIEGLGDTGTTETLAAAVGLVTGALAATHRFQTRRAAAEALGRLAQGTVHLRRARETLERSLDDRHFAVRHTAASALARLRDTDALPAMEDALKRELDGRSRRRIGRAINNLRTGVVPPDEMRRLREEVDELRTTTSTLRERLEKLEGPGSKPSPSPAAGPHAVSARRRPSPSSRRSGKRPPRRPPRR